MWHQIAPSLERGSRIHGNVNGRFVTAIRLLDGRLKCIDSTCYHAGGPLGLGEIEDVNGESCIKCPWHAYPVSLSDGSKLYESLELDKATKKLVPSGWRKKERAQRVHEIEERKGGEIWVKLSTSEQKYDSDEYAGSVVCGERVKAGDVTGAKKGRDGIMPTTSSGQVFADQRWKPCKVVKIEKDGLEGIRIKLLAGPTFKPKPYPTLMMNSIELFSHHYIAIRIGSIHRFYTPIIGEGDEDEILTLAVRVYPHGAVSSSLSRLKVGDLVDVRKSGETDPPSCQLTELGIAHFFPQKFKRVVLLAGGSGITALFSVAHSVLENTPDAFVTLVCFDKTISSILGRDIVAKLAIRKKPRLIVVRAISHKDPKAKTIEGEFSLYTEQHVDPDFLKKICFPVLQKNEERILFSWCGPSKFSELVPEVLNEAGFSKETNAFFVPFVG